MDVPPPHVLLQLDAIIVAQRESDGSRVVATASAAASPATPRHERALTPPEPVARKGTGGHFSTGGAKPVEMRRIGDAEWRWFGSHTDAAKAFGLKTHEVSRLINDRLKGGRGQEKTAPKHLRETFETRSVRRARKTCEIKRKRPAKKSFVEGATQKANGKWCNYYMFPGREFEDLDEYRAAKAQRAAQRDNRSCVYL